MAPFDEASLPLMEDDKLPSSIRFLSKIKATLLRLWFLRPKSNIHDPKELKKTAYLDGLRGFSALLVYLHHHLIWAHSDKHGLSMYVLENPYSLKGRHYNFVCLPIIRVFFTGGNSAVAMFFLISGYVLSVSPLNALYSSDPARFANYLGSALFRRWIRLFLPVIATTMTWATIWHIVGIKSNNPIAKSPEATYAVEIWEFYRNFKMHSFLFYESFWNEYNDHLWSIPLEFRGSIFIWITLLAFAQSSATMRVYLELAMAAYLTCIVDGWPYACFVIGLLLCECDVLTEKGQLPRLLSYLRVKRSWIYWLFILTGMYLLGVPSIMNTEDAAKDVEQLRTLPGWYYLSFFIPEPFSDYRWWYRIIAGTLIMISTPRLPILKMGMESRFCQFLGKHSYALYLVHGPILWSIGDRVYAAVGRTTERHLVDIPTWMDLIPLPGWGPLGLELNYLVAQMFLLPFTLWIASLVTKTIDEPSVRFAKWIFGICCASEV